MRRLLGCFAAVAIVLVPFGSWGTSCFLPPDLDRSGGLQRAIAQAPVVFVGLVERGGRVARVRVQEVWRGPALPAVVFVRGGPLDEGTFTSVDREFQQGTRYLFVPSGSAPRFLDNACSLTRPFGPALEGLRPEGVRDPSLGVGEPFWSRGWVQGAGVGLVLAGGIAGLAWSQKRLR